MNRKPLFARKTLHQSLTTLFLQMLDVSMANVYSMMSAMAVITRKIDQALIERV